jgi:hypothetical protein
LALAFLGLASGVGRDFTGQDPPLKPGKGAELAFVAHLGHEAAAGFHPIVAGDAVDVLGSRVILVEHHVTGPFFEDRLSTAEPSGRQWANGGHCASSPSRARTPCRATSRE